MLSQKKTTLNEEGQTGSVDQKRKRVDNLDEKDDFVGNESMMNSSHRGDMVGSELVDPPQKKKPSSRCQMEGCRKKLGLIEKSIGKCKCDLMFCQKHSFPGEHKCTYDYRLAGKDRLKSQLVAVRAEKITKI